MGLIKDAKNGNSYSLKYLLKNDVESTLSKKGIKLRKLFAPLIRLAYSSTNTYKLKIVKKAKLSNDKVGKIFLVNHRQPDDMVNSSRVVGESGYFVFGNKTLVLESTTNGYGLWAHGIILLDRDNKENRHACYEKMKYVLQNGGNVIIFPEGYWNLDDNGLSDERHYADDHNSESWLIQDINAGSIRLAQEIGCELVPTIMHYDEVGSKKCYAVRGEPIKVLPEDDILEKKDEVLSIMTNIYWDLMSEYSNYCRKELEKNGLSLKEQWEILKKELLKGSDIPRVNYKLDLTDEKRIGKARSKNSVDSNEEVFSFVKKLTPNKNNAFMFDKNNIGIKK